MLHEIMKKTESSSFGVGGLPSAVSGDGHQLNFIGVYIPMKRSSDPGTLGPAIVLCYFLQKNRCIEPQVVLFLCLPTVKGGCNFFVQINHSIRSAAAPRDPLVL